MPSKTCTWTSMTPGGTLLPLAETTLRARAAGMFGETSRSLASLTATSSGSCRFCAGSTTVPPLISKSQSGDAFWAGDATARPRLLETSTPDPKMSLENWRRVSISTSWSARRFERDLRFQARLGSELWNRLECACSVPGGRSRICIFATEGSLVTHLRSVEAPLQRLGKDSEIHCVQASSLIRCRAE